MSNRIGKIKLPARVVLGYTEITVEQLAGLGTGSIVELDSLAGEPVDLVVAGKVVARGEVLVIDEKFGLRVTSLTGEEE